MDGRGGGIVRYSGHRGTRERAIENTAAAFQFCVDHGVDYIEFDVKATRDGRLVVFHDERVDRLLSGTGFLADFSLAELRELRYADGQRVLTLEELFEQVGKRTRLMLEIKSRGVSRPVVEALRRHGYGPPDVIVQSFDRRDIEECRRIEPDLPYGLCFGRLGRTPLFRRAAAERFLRTRVDGAGATWLNLDGPFVYDEFMDAAAARGLRIILGAASPENYLGKLERWRVEIVNADDPVRLRALLEVSAAAAPRGGTPPQ